MELVIGTRKWSTWSLRPWLVMRRAGLDFETTEVTLRQPDTTERLSAYSPSSQCPVLIDDGGFTVWDSLAICEYLADRFPEKHLWPADPQARALGRVACAMMHSGFMALRQEHAMALEAEPQAAALSEAAAKNLRTIVRLWLDLRLRYGAKGPFLLGDWSIADAYYTPVATRMRTYQMDLLTYGDDGTCADYAALLLEQPEFREWEQSALAA
jgi:glutathione S-transferase